MAVEITVVPVGRAQPAEVHVVSDEDIREDVLSLLQGSDWIQTYRHEHLTTYRKVTP
jgi:hypothetical protein